jgi:hypothetical protein
MSDELMAAASDPSVHKALAQKVRMSRISLLL